MGVVLYHDAGCEPSRNVLALIRIAGIEPHVDEYLKVPPSRTMIEWLLSRMGISVRGLLREKGTSPKEQKAEA